jgi:hypothetical protein
MKETFDATLRGKRPDGSFKMFMGELVVYQEESKIISFINALQHHKPERLFVHFGSWGFVTQQHEAHVLIENDAIKIDEIQRINDQIVQASQPLDVELVDGFIRSYDQTSQIFQIFDVPVEFYNGFRTNEEVQTVLENNYQQWLQAAKQQTSQDPNVFIQYYWNSYSDKLSQTVDLTSGNLHFVIRLVPTWEIRTLEDVKKDFPDIRMQDNTAIYDWGRVIFLYGSREYDNSNI